MLWIALIVLSKYSCKNEEAPAADKIANTIT